MLTGQCHCGALSFRFDDDPGDATACNCTICRRYGALWIYGWEGENVTVAGPSVGYRRGLHCSYEFCGKCGCVVYYRAIDLEPDGRRKLAFNIRMADDPEAVACIQVLHFDGFDTFEDLPPDGRRVRDHWF